MNSLPDSTVSPSVSRQAILAASAGVPYAWNGAGSPIDAWADLMEAVEALCPHWPERAAAVGGSYRL
jgi:hypothetical protein